MNKTKHMQKTLTFYPNGNIMAFNEAGEQIQELQAKGWMELFFEFMDSKGYNPAEFTIQSRNNNGEFKEVIPYKQQDGSWNPYFKLAPVDDVWG